jgi:hypothetical protein
LARTWPHRRPSCFLHQGGGLLRFLSCQCNSFTALVGMCGRPPTFPAGHHWRRQSAMGKGRRPGEIVDFNVNAEGDRHIGCLGHAPFLRRFPVALPIRKRIPRTAAVQEKTVFAMRHRFGPFSVLLTVCVLLLPVPGVRAGEQDLSGSWHGDWLSCRTGHRGKLNARFCRIGETCYSVRFTGTFFAVVPFCFNVTLQATGQADGTVLLSGNPRLPIFGTFHFSAVATDGQLAAVYSTTRDEGRFRLCR